MCLSLGPYTCQFSNRSSSSSDPPQPSGLSSHFPTFAGKGGWPVRLLQFWGSGMLVFIHHGFIHHGIAVPFAFS